MITTPLFMHTGFNKWINERCPRIGWAQRNNHGVRKCEGVWLCPKHIEGCVFRARPVVQRYGKHFKCALCIMYSRISGLLANALGQYKIAHYRQTIGHYATRVIVYNYWTLCHKGNCIFFTNHYAFTMIVAIYTTGTHHHPPPESAGASPIATTCDYNKGERRKLDGAATCSWS